MPDKTYCTNNACRRKGCPHYADRCSAQFTAFAAVAMYSWADLRNTELCPKNQAKKAGKDT